MTRRKTGQGLEGRVRQQGAEAPKCSGVIDAGDVATRAVGQACDGAMVVGRRGIYDALLTELLCTQRAKLQAGGEVEAHTLLTAARGTRLRGGVILARDGAAALTRHDTVRDLPVTAKRAKLRFLRVTVSSSCRHSWLSVAKWGEVWAEIGVATLKCHDCGVRAQRAVSQVTLSATVVASSATRRPG